MTSPPDLLSERSNPMGNVASAGVWNQLGRPELDRLSLLLRESVQNSWDARVEDSIDFRMDAWSLTAEQRAGFGRFFLHQPPLEAYNAPLSISEKIEPLKDWLTSAPRVLVVADRRTTGLDGPTRADEGVDSGTTRNFVNFLRNVGQPPQKTRGGGTFGYGKAAFYLASRTRTIVVHTRCRHEGRIQSRLTAAALSHHYDVGSVRHTGRHWWGVRSGDHVVEPFVDEEADRIAKSLGLPAFSNLETGTSICICSPAFDDGELKALGPLCLRHLWPKLRSEKGRPPINLSIRVSGHPVPVPDPAVTSPYDAFWRSLSRVRQGQGEPIRYQSTVVGHVALERALTFPEHAPNAAAEDEADSHEVNPKHVALLRAPELVVKYLDGGRGLGSELLGFAGVFMASPEVDHVFAISEPPTHDDWQPKSVADPKSRGIVTKTLRDVRRYCRDFATPKSPKTQAGDGHPLARLALEFAALLPGLTGSGPSREHDKSVEASESRRRTRAARPVARVSEHHEVLEVAGTPHAVFTVEVTHALETSCTVVSAEIYSVLSDGAREASPPTGCTLVSGAWWESPRGARVETHPLVVRERQQGSWRLFVPLAQAVAVAVEVSATAGAA